MSNLCSVIIVMSSVLLKVVLSESAPKRVSSVRNWWVEPVSTWNRNFYSDSIDIMMMTSSEPVTLVPSESAPMILKVLKWWRLLNSSQVSQHLESDTLDLVIVLTQSLLTLSYSVIFSCFGDFIMTTSESVI